MQSTVHILFIVWICNLLENKVNMISQNSPCAIVIKITFCRLFTMLLHFSSTLSLHIDIDTLYLPSPYSLSMFVQMMENLTNLTSDEWREEPRDIMSSDLPSIVTNEHFLVDYMNSLFPISCSIYGIWNFNVGTLLWLLYPVHNLKGSQLWSWCLIIWEM